MHLGQRKIRSAGRSSGSIEITLPVPLQALEGVPCRINLRDGVRPEVVLQPDLSEAQTLFQTLWSHLRTGLRSVDDIGDFALSQFTVALLPVRFWQERPPLFYTDALLTLHGTGDERADALTRLLAGLGVGAAQALGFSGALGLGLGDALSFVATGRSAGWGAEFERGLAHRLYWGETAPAYTPLDEAFWQEAAPRLVHLTDVFWSWHTDPDRYDTDRERWYRALTAEMRYAPLPIS
ncbi:MAG: hypothetical protein AAGI71_02980 [Bacteroidota bacterium]